MSGKDRIDDLRNHRLIIANDPREQLFTRSQFTDQIRAFRLLPTDARIRFSLVHPVFVRFALLKKPADQVLDLIGYFIF